MPPATAPQEQNGDVAVVIDRLSKHFGSAPALQDLSAQIRYGRLTGLVGPDRRYVVVIESLQPSGDAVARATITQAVKTIFPGGRI